MRRTPLFHLRILLFSLMVVSTTTLWSQAITLPMHPGSVRFAAIGDMGTGTLPQYEVAAEMVQARTIFRFDFVLMLGDNVYGGNSPADYQKKFELPYKPLLDDGVKFYAAAGNHDSPTEKSYKPFNMNGQSYYTYKKDNVEFFVLDSNYMNPAQLTWIEKALAASTAEWKIPYFHHPLYSSGSFHGPAVELRGLLEPLFMKYGVRVVFAGHEHLYERIQPQHGIYYFTEGASGELRKGNLKKTLQTAVGYDQDRSFLLVEISGDELDFQAISRTGATVDSGVVMRVVSPAIP